MRPRSLQTHPPVIRYCPDLIPEQSIRLNFIHTRLLPCHLIQGSTDSVYISLYLTLVRLVLPIICCKFSGALKARIFFIHQKSHKFFRFHIFSRHYIYPLIFYAIIHCSFFVSTGYDTHPHNLYGQAFRYHNSIILSYHFLIFDSNIIKLY